MEDRMNESKVLAQLESLVLDQFQVVSYKWLSRKFSLSSNTAKRLLQDLADRTIEGIEVVYVVSGWTNGEPSCYFVQLVPFAMLEATKAGLAGSPSIHVYSLQPSIPKDPAHLWSADFVQAEELFNQPPDVDNCLRDNRFSAVSCSLVTRNLKGKLVRVTPPDPGTESHTSFATDKIPSVGPGSTVVVSAPIILKPASGKVKDPLVNKDLNPSELQGKVLPPTAGKQTTGGPHVQGPSGQSHALKSFWGRAPGKPQKSPKASPHSDLKSGAAVLETGEDFSGDDDAVNFSRLRRGRIRKDMGRKCRVIFDDEKSDSQEEHHMVDTEDVVSLASPELPKESSVSTVEYGMKTLSNELRGSGSKKNVNVAKDHIKDQMPSKLTFLQKSAPDEKDQKVSSNNAQPKIAKISSAAVDSKAMEVPGPQPSEMSIVGKADYGTDSTSTDNKSGSKKRKVLKTRLDDRGREVTEVVWEMDQTKGSNGAAEHDVPLPSAVAKPQTDRIVPPANIKTSTALPRTSTNKTGSKPVGKSTGKVPQQGNLLSFFSKKG